MRHLRLVPVFVILALAIAGAAAALAADDPGTETKTLSDPAVDASQTRLSALLDSTAVVGWRERRGDDQVARLAYRASDGTWKVEPPIEATGDVERMVVAVGTGGRAAAAWERFDGQTTTVQVASRADDGSWSVSSPPYVADAAVDRILPAVAVRADRAVVALWQLSGRQLEYATRSAAGVWSQPAAIGVIDTRYQPALASAGGVTAVAFVASSGARRAVYVSSLGTDDRFSEPARISLPGEVGSPAIALEPAGHATVAWARANGEDWIAQVTRGRDDGSFPRAQSVLTLTDSLEAAPRLRLVVTPSGRAALGGPTPGSARRPQIVKRDLNGAWTPRDAASVFSSGDLSFDLSDAGQLVQGSGSTLVFDAVGRDAAVAKQIDTCPDNPGFCVLAARPAVAALSGGRALLTWFEHREHAVVVVGIADDVPPPPPADVSEDDTSSADDSGAGFHVAADGSVRIAIACQAARSCLVRAQLDTLRLPGGTATVASPRRVLAPGHRGAFALRLSVPARAELARSGKLHARLWVHQRVGSRTRLDRRDVLLTAR